MGGGGTMRAAAKVAGYTVANHGRRVFSDPNPLPGFSNSIRSSASAHPLDDIKLVSSQNDSYQSVSEIDEWVLAGFEEDEDVIPRVVFRGGPPSLQEAKEATAELAVALEKTYLTPTTKSVGEAVENGFGNSQVVETVAASETVARRSAPNQAIQAFKLLHESSTAQIVVASIASDQNVWSAVLKNPQLQEFLHSQRTPEYVGTEHFDVLDESSATSSECGSSETDNGYIDIVEKIKSAVVNMMSNLSSLFQNSFGGHKVFTNSDGSARVSADTVMEGSFMGLAVMAIMVIVLKRE